MSLFDKLQAQPAPTSAAPAPEPAPTPATPTPATAMVTAAPLSEAALVLASPDAEAALQALQQAGFLGDMSLMDINEADQQLGSQMPRLFVVQKAEQAEDGTAKPGALRHALTGQEADVVTATLIAQKFGRQYLAPFDPNSTGIQVICASSDGQIRDWPDDRSCDPAAAPRLGSRCATCPHAKWNGQKPPACSEIFTLLVFLHEWHETMAFIVRRTAIKPWRTAAQRIKGVGLRMRTRHGLPVNLTVQFEINTAKVGNGRMSWYEPRFASFAPVADPMTLQEILSCLPLVPRFAETLTEEFEEGATDVFDEAIAGNANPTPAPLSPSMEAAAGAPSAYASPRKPAPQATWAQQARATASDEPPRPADDIEF
jgi:peptidoglycan hydrolase-like protein with peptidoglycan-binding domain